MEFWSLMFSPLVSLIIWTLCCSFSSVAVLSLSLLDPRHEYFEIIWVVSWSFWSWERAKKISLSKAITPVESDPYELSFRSLSWSFFISISTFLRDLPAGHFGCGCFTSGDPDTIIDLLSALDLADSFMSSIRSYFKPIWLNSGSSTFFASTGSSAVFIASSTSPVFVPSVSF